MAMNPRLLRPIRKLNPEAQDWVNRVFAAGSSVSGPVAKAVSNFVTGCQSDGIWDKMKSLVLLAGVDTLTGALVPIKGTAPTPYNFADGNYNKTSGLKGDGSTTYLDSNRAGNADAQNNVHFCTFVTEIATQGGTGTPSNFPCHMGAGSGGVTGQRHFGIDAAGNNGFSRNTAGTANTINNIRTATGFLGSSRDNGSDYVFRMSGSTSSPISQASQEPISTTNFGVFRALGGTSPNLVYYNGRLSYYSIGESLDLALLDARVSALMTALGVS